MGIETDLTSPHIDRSSLIELAAEITAAYVENHSIPAAELPALIKAVFSALSDMAFRPVEAASEPTMSDMVVRKSITKEYLICLEDGLKFKSLRQHLRHKYNLSPDDYRAKWGLPSDYPMVAPAYSARRAVLAKEIFGQGRLSASSKSVS